MKKKREVERLRRAVDDVADLHDEAVRFIDSGVRSMNALHDALLRAAEEVKAARAALEAADALDKAG